MRILITGAAGFVGQLLAKTLLDEEQGRYDLILTDVIEPAVPEGVRWKDKAKVVKANLVDQSQTFGTEDVDAVYVLHGIMSSGSEANFEQGMQGNVDATRALLETLRATKPGVKVIYASSQAVYGGWPTEPITESTRPTPQSSYGCQKVVCEYLVNDYTRRGFIDGLIVRLPTVSVRPGKPTAAASSFLSGMVREPMQGLSCVIPIQNRGWAHCLCSPSTLVRNLVHALALPDDALPPHDRVVNLPGMRVTVQEIMDSLARVGGDDRLQYLEEKEDEAVKAILSSWPAGLDYAKALELGFSQDSSFDEAVREFQAGLGV